MRARTGRGEQGWAQGTRDREDTFEGEAGGEAERGGRRAVWAAGARETADVRGSAGGDLTVKRRVGDALGRCLASVSAVGGAGLIGRRAGGRRCPDATPCGRGNGCRCLSRAASVPTSLLFLERGCPLTLWVSLVMLCFSNHSEELGVADSVECGNDAEDVLFSRQSNFSPKTSATRFAVIGAARSQAIAAPPRLRALRKCWHLPLRVCWQGSS